LPSSLSIGSNRIDSLGLNLFPQVPHRIATRRGSRFKAEAASGVTPGSGSVGRGTCLPGSGGPGGGSCEGGSGSTAGRRGGGPSARGIGGALFRSGSSLPAVANSPTWGHGPGPPSIGNGYWTPST
jgi:hypothetical protein